MKLLIAGDFSPRLRLKTIVDNREFEPLFGKIKSVFEGNDLNIVNFETTVANPSFKPINKIGARLKTTPEACDALKYLGVNVVTLANNHAFDYGLPALELTLSELKKREIQTVGAGLNRHEASQPLYQTINGETIAIINCCEHEYGIATDDCAGTNPLNAVSQFYAITEARKKADYTIVIVHGGHEHFQLPSLRMQDLYRYFIDLGADAVINYHQHCFSGMEIYKGKPIYYGLGNFAFDTVDSGKKNWSEGILVKLELNAGNVNSEAIPYTQFADTPSVEPTTDTVKFKSEFQRLSDIICNREKLNSELEKYYNSSQRSVFTMLQPWTSRILKGAFFRGWIPSIVSKQSLAWIQNWIVCESHFEKVQYFLDKNACSTK
ncbi:MAG: CapA family protein [Muribaculum sp.]|nr:CapA family protein [Muribaculum sp.]